MPNIDFENPNIEHVTDMTYHMADDWYQKLEKEFNKDYFRNLAWDISLTRSGPVPVYPPAHEVFTALRLTPFENVKAVILGQDPYHGPNQAHGLAFSVKKFTPFPPSLRNIFKEYSAQLGKPIPEHGDLSKWAEEGVLLLNTTLTVEKGSPMSHAGRGWERLTDKIIQCINDKDDQVLFLLWGAHAQSKESLIDTEKHRVLKSAHPSPLSAHRGFFGNGHFVELRKHLANVS